MQHLKFTLTIALASAVWVATGCSKKESEPAPTPTEAAAPEQTEAPPVRATPPPPFEGRTTATPDTSPQPPVMPSPAMATEETPEQLAAQVRQLETTYHNTPEFPKRVAIIYEMSSVESPATIDTMGRLIAVESDDELKIELINSLSDIEGENDKKLTILAAAVRAGVPQEVRLEAIDALVETEDKRAIPILEGLLKDSDEDIRDASQDGIEQLQEDTAPMQPTP